MSIRIFTKSNCGNYVDLRKKINKIRINRRICIVIFLINIVLKLEAQEKRVIIREKIDSIVENGIKEKAYPGCQIYVIKDGKVLINKAYGYHTYDNTKRVKTTDLYDIASVTKAAATTLCIMKLYEEGKIDIDDILLNYLTYLKGSNKENITIKEILAHQAGLKSWVSFHKKLTEEEKRKIFKKKEKPGYSINVAKGLYMRDDYRDSIIKQILETEVDSEKKYLYSDLGFYLLSDLVEKMSGKSIDVYAEENFYKPMQLSRILYKPLLRFNKNEIVPTTDDKTFRKQIVQGYVHDEGAAMMGGVSGHAGLFANAEDLGKLINMIIDSGNYNGKQYFKYETIKKFIARQFEGNRRGGGFDKPMLKKGEEGPSCDEVSENSFGHSGFTGAYFWADPDYNLVYVFLSNRVWPDASENKLAKMNIRTNIQKLIYELIE